MRSRLNRGRLFNDGGREAVKGLIKRGRHKLAFAGLYLFILMLYLRPNDLIPGLGQLPLVKFYTFILIAVFIASMLWRAQRPVISFEAKMMMAMVALAILFAPVAASPRDTIETLQEPFLKIVIIFIIMTNLIDTRERLFSIWGLLAFSGAIFGVDALYSLMTGQLEQRGERIYGMVRGMFGNPNDLATALNLIIPLCFVLVLSKKRVWRWVYAGFLGAMVLGVFATQSRSGFLGLAAVLVFMLWKFGRKRRLTMFLCAAVLVIGGLAIFRSSITERLSSIVAIEEDETGSAQQRLDLLKRSLYLAVRRPIIGLGMGNIRIYSIQELKAHNAFVEVSAELGLAGLLAYLAIIFVNVRAMRRIESQTMNSEDEDDRRHYYISLGLQASLMAYIICSFFASIQYQWFLYLIAAYAVAYRGIYKAEAAESGPVTEIETANSSAFSKKRKRGRLWVNSAIGKGVLINTPSRLASGRNQQ